MDSSRSLALVQLSFDYEANAIDTKEAKSLEKHAKAICDTVERVRRTTAEGVMKLGAELTAAHAKLSNHGDGTFGKWCSLRCGLTARHARNMMGVCDTFKDREMISQSADPTALYLLSAPSCPEEATAEALERAEQGERITTKLARDIIKSHPPRVNREEPDADTINLTNSGCDVRHGDCLELMQEMAAGSVDLVFGSPPYEDARTYGISFDLVGDAWVDWMFERVMESLRVCKGLVAFVVEGKTKQYRWSATPVLLMAKLHQAGVHLRKPVIYKRQGIPGAGGPDWLRNDYEFVLCCTNGGDIPGADNTACGTKPKWGNEGSHSPRKKDGTFTESNYSAPEKVNPGNVIECVAGGGTMGSKRCHENEAPFPEKLAEFFVRSFCPAGGIVLDPFCGSGTTLAVARCYGRQGIGMDIRKSQVTLSKKRVANETTRLVVA